MRTKYLILLFLQLLIISCKTTSKITEGNNNEIVVKEKNSKFMITNHETKIIFNGQNNKIIFEYLDSFFNNDNNKDIIIIEGDGNVIRLTHDNIIDNSKNDIDTLLISTNDSYIELISKYFIDNKNDTTTYNFDFENNYKIIEISNESYLYDSTTTENKLIGKWMLVKDVYDYYLKQSLIGDKAATFYLGEFYEMGIGTKKDFKKAEYYYLISAKKGYSDAQASLAYLYENEIIEIPNGKDKAIEWYEKAAKQGNEYAIERLTILKN